jgi:hypothetical protein
MFKTISRTFSIVTMFIAAIAVTLGVAGAPAHAGPALSMTAAPAAVAAGVGPEWG